MNVVQIHYIAIQNRLLSKDFWFDKCCRSLDKTISSLEMELSVARMNRNGLQQGGAPGAGSAKQLPKVFAVIGINTAFSSKKRRDSLRNTWMPKGGKYVHHLDYF